MKPWTPSFNPATDILSSAPVWVRLPNLPLHFWGLPSLEAIGSALGKFHFACRETSRHNTSTFSCICVEMDFSKGFPTEVILTGKNYSWSQKLDYERVSLRCRSCFEMGHLATHCPKGPKKNRKPRKSTWWVGSNDHQVIKLSRSPLKPVKRRLSQILLLIQLVISRVQNPIKSRRKRCLPLRFQMRDLESSLLLNHQLVGQIRLMMLGYWMKKK
jgi:hypothetical protein